MRDLNSVLPGQASCAAAAPLPTPSPPTPPWDTTQPSGYGNGNHGSKSNKHQTEWHVLHGAGTAPNRIGSGGGGGGPVGGWRSTTGGAPRPSPVQSIMSTGARGGGGAQCSSAPQTPRRGGGRGEGLTQAGIAHPSLRSTGPKPWPSGSRRSGLGQPPRTTPQSGGAGDAVMVPVCPGARRGFDGGESAHVRVVALGGGGAPPSDLVPHPPPCPCSRGAARQHVPVTQRLRWVGSVSGSPASPTAAWSPGHTHSPRPPLSAPGAWPLLILPPALKRKGSPRRQGLCARHRGCSLMEPPACVRRRGRWRGPRARRALPCPRGLPGNVPVATLRLRRGGGGQFFFHVLGAFLNSPFRSEHFECTHVRRGQPPFPVHLKWGGNWGADVCPGPQRQQKCSGCSRLFLVVHCCVCGGGWRHIIEEGLYGSSGGSERRAPVLQRMTLVVSALAPSVYTTLT